MMMPRLSKQELGGGVGRGGGERARTCSLGAGIDGEQDRGCQGPGTRQRGLFQELHQFLPCASLRGCGGKRAKTAGQRS